MRASRSEGHRLAARVLAAGFDLYAGHLFVFLSKRKSHCKVLTWDQNGMLVLFKRIEVGHFHLPVIPEGATSVSLDAASLAVLLQGIDIKALPAAKSWSPPPRGSTADPACDLVRP